LFSLTFSINASSHQDQSVVKTIMKNTADSGGKVLVPSEGFQSLKLLCFSALLLPLLSFLEGAMPKLPRLSCDLGCWKAPTALKILTVSNKLFFESAKKLLKLPG
jgi:hypothetical protein